MMRALPEANGQNSIDLIRRAGNVVLSSLAAFFLLGCNVGPNYKRPATDLPSGYRSMLAPDISTSLSQASIADEKWTKIFQDPVLALLVKEALAGNLRPSEVGAWLRKVVNGYYQYHAVPGNLDQMRTFRQRVNWLWRNTLVRRSQRARKKWELLTPIFERWIPRPCILHPYPQARFHAIHPS
jgi:hypothetical protein